MMASDCSDDCVCDFPPLIESMRLNIEGGPMYRGGRGGRAAAAYYREKEVIIALKNKYGNRYGRRIQSYKPDTEAWRPERYQRRNDTLKSHTSEVVPGGLQNKKPLIHIHDDWWAQTSGRADQREILSPENHIPEKYSSGRIKNEGVSVTSSRTSYTIDIAELVRPSQQGRGMMRGKRVVDISAIYCADEKEQLTVNCITNKEKKDPESNKKKDEEEMINCEYNQSSTKLTESDEKERRTVNCVTNKDKRGPESNTKKDEENMINSEYNQSSGELTESDEKERLTVNCITNKDKRDPESNTKKDEENMINSEYNQSSGELAESGPTVNFITNPEKREPESSTQEDMINRGSSQSPSELIKPVENLSTLRKKKEKRKKKKPIQHRCS